MADERDIITIEVRDPDNQLIRLLDYIKGVANVGHSYDVVVDPHDKEYNKSFGIDGDGAFYMYKIKKNGKEVKFEDNKLVEQYLERIQK